MVLQLPMHPVASEGGRELPLEKRGHIAFDSVTDYETLQGRLEEGWGVRGTTLSDEHGFDELAERLGERGTDWLLLAAVSPAGTLRLSSHSHPVSPKSGWTVILMAAEHDRARN